MNWKDGRGRTGQIQSVSADATSECNRRDAVSRSPSYSVGFTIAPFANSGSSLFLSLSRRRIAETRTAPSSPKEERRILQLTKAGGGEEREEREEERRGRERRCTSTFSHSAATTEESQLVPNLYISSAAASPSFDFERPDNGNGENGKRRKIALCVTVAKHRSEGNAESTQATRLDHGKGRSECGANVVGVGGREGGASKLH